MSIDLRFSFVKGLKNRCAIYTAWNVLGYLLQWESYDKHKIWSSDLDKLSQALWKPATTVLPDSLIRIFLLEYSPIMLAIGLLLALSEMLISIKLYFGAALCSAKCNMQELIMTAILTAYGDILVIYIEVHGANMGPIWGRQDPFVPYIGPMNFAI